MSIYDTLNEQQKQGVFAVDGPVLLLAGAGSGKTRVLTHRIAYLIDEIGVQPYNIMAITFTNKAAGEMRERVDSIIGYGASQVWVSTFHSTCVRILHRYIDRIGYDNNFTIYDTDDQKTVMKEVCKRLQIDTKMLKEKQKFKELHESYVIFITKNDYMKMGLPLYHVERTVQESGALFGDGAHIIYVNGSYKNDSDPVGKLMHDFRCTSAVDMFYQELAKSVRHFKETEGGRSQMSKAMEERINREKDKERIETLFGVVEDLMEAMKMTAEQAMSLIKISDEDKAVLFKRF